MKYSQSPKNIPQVITRLRLASIFLVSTLLFSASVFAETAHANPAESTVPNMRLAEGDIYGFGLNQYGRTGQNLTGMTNTPRPEPVLAPEGNLWRDVVVGNTHSIGITIDGRLFSWGNNGFGQRGTGLNTGDALRPMPVSVGHLPQGTRWKAVAAGHRHSLAITTDGELFAWGQNQFGKTGLDLHAGVTSVPTAVHMDNVPPGTTWKAICAGYEHSLAITTDGQLFAFGQNQFGKTGLGTSSDATRIPTPVRTDNLPKGDDTRWIDISASAHHSAGITSEGQLFSWGSNNDARTGLGLSAGQTTMPTAVHMTNVAAGADARWKSVSVGYYHSMALSEDGVLYTWGNNSWGRTGLGTSDGLTTAPQAANIDNLDTGVRWHQIDAYYHSLGLTTDGRIYAWGRNMQNRTSQIAPLYAGILIPTEIYSAHLPDDHFWQAIAAGAAHSLAIAAVEIELPEAPDGYVVKTLQMPEGTTPPAASFRFNFTAVQRTFETETGHTVSSIAVADVPGIDDEYISFTGSEPRSVSNGIVTVQDHFPLAPILEALTFPRSGMYIWEITEVLDSSGTTAPGHMNYSAARFELRVTVGPPGSVFNLHITNIELVPLTAQEGGEDLLESGKVNYARFVNVYTRLASDALVISKRVEGDFANLSEYFDFDLYLTIPGWLPAASQEQIPQTFSAQIVEGSGAGTLVQNVTIVPESNTFRLRHGQRLVIPQLLAGMIFSVYEEASPAYEPSAVVIVGGVRVVPDYSAAVGESLMVGETTRRIHDLAGSSVAFTNLHHHAVPTGLTAGRVPLLMAAVAVLLLGSIAASRWTSRRIECLDEIARYQQLS